MIISLVQTKGGTGKSTLSQCLAFSPAFRKVFKTIALVELDIQGTLKRWWRTREELERNAFNVVFYHVTSKDPAEIQQQMEEIVETNDLLILDVPGESVSRFHTSFACAISDLILVPMRTSTNDEDAFEANMLPIIDKVLDLHPEKNGSFYVIPTFTHPLANASKLIAYFRAILPDYVRCLDTVFPSRSIFENCNREGLNLYEYARLVRGNQREYAQSRNAERDIANIANEVLNIG